MTSQFVSRGAEKYHAYMGRWSRKLAPLFLDFSGLGDGEHVLAAGCGAGSLTRKLPGRASFKSVEAIDYEQQFVDAAGELNTDPRINIQHGDVCTLEFANGEFDRAPRSPEASIHKRRREPSMQKQIIKAASVAETGGPFNLCVKHGNMIYVSGLPPFDAEYAGALKAARASKQPIPPFPDVPFEKQVRIVMDNLKALVEAAGSNMDCLLKVVVWLKDQRQQEEFDRIYRSYFTSQETLPARTRMQAGRTPMDCGLEVDAIGYVP